MTTINVLAKSLLATERAAASDSIAVLASDNVSVTTLSHTGSSIWLADERTLNFSRADSTAVLAATSAPISASGADPAPSATAAMSTPPETAVQF
jgi:hypothetical protein